jgi:hypothetical protein
VAPNPENRMFNFHPRYLLVDDPRLIFAGMWVRVFIHT